MVGMLMGDKDGLHLLHIQTQYPHPPLGLAAGEAGIHKHRLGLISYIVTIPIRARVERSYLKCHSPQISEVGKGKSSAAHWQHLYPTNGNIITNSSLPFHPVAPRALLTG